MSLSVDHPWALFLLVACVPALLGSGARWLGFASLAAIPRDPLSGVVDATLRSFATLALAAIVLGIAGLHAGGGEVARIGTGAHVVVVLDRSLSMDEPFALRAEKGTESKSAAAARLLAAFFAQHPHDSFGIVAFSTSPIPAMPLTAHRDAIAASIRAMGRTGLANTDIGAGLALGLAQYDRDPRGAARVLLLVSDGAGDITEATRAYIRKALTRSGAHLYYLYLRSGDDPPLAEKEDDSHSLDRPAGTRRILPFARCYLSGHRGARYRGRRNGNAAYRCVRVAPDHLPGSGATTRAGRLLFQRGRFVPRCGVAGAACGTRCSENAHAAVKIPARTLRAWAGATALATGAACLAVGGFTWWQTHVQNARLAAIARGQDVVVDDFAPDIVQLAEGRRLISRGNLDGAQIRADHMAARAASISRAELLYALGNAQLRRGLALMKTDPYPKAAPALRLARTAYREALRLDPGNWDARYNYALVSPLLRDDEAAIPTTADTMAHERAAWPDIPGAPNGMP